MSDFRVPILLDECVSDRVAAALRAAGFEASHVTEIGRRGRTDYEQLEYAAEQGMALLTYNIADFQNLHREWAMVGKSHAGILLALDRVYQKNPGGLASDVGGTLLHYGQLHGT